MIDNNTKTGTDIVTPPTKDQVDAALTNMQKFVKPSITPLKASDYSTEEFADINSRMSDDLMIQADAKRNVDVNIALHKLMLEVDEDEDKFNLDVDVVGMRESVYKSDYTDIEKQRYGRAMQVIEAASEKNLTVMRSKSGRYWFESKETGKPVYAVNGILEVKQLLDKFGGFSEDGDNNEEEPNGKKKEGAKKVLDLVDITPDNYEEGLSEAHKYLAVAFGVDLVSSLAGVGLKMTGVGAPIGGTVSVLGGIAAAALSTYSDIINDDVTNWETFANLGIRTGFELLETATVLPASLLSGFVGAGRLGSVIKRTLQLGMAAGVVTTAQNADWTRIQEKIISDPTSLGIEDLESLAVMGQFIIGFVGSSASRVNYKKKIKTNTAIAKSPEAQAKVLKQVIKKNPTKLTPKYKTELKDKYIAKASKSKADIETQRIETNKKIRDESKKANIEADKKAKEDLEKTESSTKTGQQELDFSPKKSFTLEQVNTKLIAKKKSIEAKKTLEIKNSGVKAKVALTANEAAVDKKFSDHMDWATKRETIENNKLVKNRIAAANDDAKKFAEDVEKDHGRIIGRSLKRASQNKALGKDAAKKLRADEQAAIKVLNKKATVLETLKKEKKELQKKGDKFLKSADGKLKLKAKNKQIKDENSNLTKAKRLASSAGNKAYSGTGKTLNAVLDLGATPLNFVSSKDFSRTASKSIIANTRSIVREDKKEKSEAEEKIAREKYVKVLEDAGYTEDMSVYSNKQLKAAVDALIKKVGMEKKQGGGSLRLVPNNSNIRIPKAQVGGSMWDKLSEAGMFSGINLLGRIVSWVKGAQEGFDYLADRNTNILTQSEGVVPVPVVVTPSVVTPSVTPSVTPADPLKKKTVIVNNYLATIEDEKKEELDPIPPNDFAAIAAIEKKYNDIIAAAKKFGESKPNGWDILNDSLSQVRPSDFFNRNRLQIERPNQEDLRAPVLYSRGDRNMPGFNAAKNSLSLIPRTDTADSFSANMMKKAYFNAAQKRKIELVGRNAQYVEKARDEKINIYNQNTTAAANTENANIQRRNQANANYAASLVQAKAQLETQENKRKGRIYNSLLEGSRTATLKARRTNLGNKYNEAAAAKNIWNTEFKVPFDEAVKNGNSLKIKELKANFVTTTGRDPDDLDKFMLDTTAQYRNL
jgi:hypothetical protein